ncbi:hypothetical protein R5R35_000520 [Gryllus longicercus]|uniref:Kynurenine formamidase n=1 Tax=Gryllus longicercus TaxID=2509291 RepID=A0AAN9ZDF6_9ORTH
MKMLFLLSILAVPSVWTYILPQRNCLLRRAVDLTRVLDTESVAATKPFVPGNLSEITLPGNITYRINDFCVGEHTGTHLDAPFHFNKDGWTVEEIPLERLISNGIFMNFSQETANNVSFRLQPDHIDQWIKQHGRFPHNAMVLISYGWSQLYWNRTAFTGTATDKFTDMVYPGMSAETATKLASMPEVVGVGVDTISIDASGEGIAHQILTAKNIYLLEDVDMDKPCIPDRGFKVFSMPIKLVNGTGTPARVIIVPEGGILK